MGPAYTVYPNAPLGLSGSPRRRSALVGRFSSVFRAVAVTPLIPPPALSNARTAVTKYFDLMAAQSSGPLIVRGSPGLRLAKSVRSVSFRLVTSASAW